MIVQKAVPVLRVADVGRSMAWYRDLLGFSADPFPAAPPYRFAILRQGPTELMLRLAPAPMRERPGPYQWDVYLRLQGEGFRELFTRLEGQGLVTRRLERMPYGLAEFEVTDPDGYALCLAHPFDEGQDLPTPSV
jgi:hypothetical protein